MPRLARTGNSESPSMNVCCPISGAGHGVAGAKMASTSEKSLSTSRWYQRRNFCALVTSEAGSMAPAISRSRVAGSKSLARVRSRLQMQACRLACCNDVGGRAGALGFRYLDVAIGAKRRGDAIDGVNRFCSPAFEIAAGDRDAQSVNAAVQQRRRRARPYARRKRDRPES